MSKTTPLQALLKSLDESEMPFVNIDTDVQVYGPVIGSELPQQLKLAIQNFRKEEADTPYLFDQYHQNLEKTLRLDERSYHLVAHKDGQLLGVMRVTPSPFETSSLNKELKEATKDFEQYLEVSRMILSEDGRQMCVGILLSFAVVSWGLKTDRKGLIALCRPKNAQRFSFLGFRPVRRELFSVDQREQGKYRLLSSEWEKFTNQLDRIFGNRLTETFWKS